MRSDLSKHVKVLALVFTAMLVASCVPPTPAAEFEQYENNAIQMVPPSMAIEYETAKPTSYQTNLPNGASGNIFPQGLVTFRYELRNLTDKNYRFEVCLGWGTQAIGCDTVTFMGQASNTIVHSAVLSPGSGHLQVQATNIIIEPGTNDVRPVYYWATLDVANACASGQTCCHYNQDGSCPECIANDGTQQCR